jgi:hypothetical protein
MVLQLFLGPGRFVSFVITYTVGRTLWTGDQPFAKPLPTRRTIHTEQTHTDIHASSGIRTHDSSVQVGEDSLCLRPRVHRDLHWAYYLKCELVGRGLYFLVAWMQQHRTSYSSMLQVRRITSGRRGIDINRFCYILCSQVIRIKSVHFYFRLLGNVNYWDKGYSHRN